MLPITIRLKLLSEHNGDYKYEIFNTDEVRVGSVAVSLWANQPMLYLTQIEIEKGSRKKGYGTAALGALTQLHCRRIVPVQETGGSFCFWIKMRSRSGVHFKVEDQISTTDWSILIGN